MFPSILMPLPCSAALGAHHHGTSLIICERSGSTIGIFPVSKSAGPRCAGRKLNVYRFITPEAMRKRHKDAVQDWVLFI